MQAPERTYALHQALMTNVSEVLPSFQYLLAKGFKVDHSPKSLRYHKKSANGNLHEVIVRAKGVEVFICEVSKVLVTVTGGRKVTSKATTGSIERCVAFVVSQGL